MIDRVIKDTAVQMILKGERTNNIATQLKVSYGIVYQWRKQLIDQGVIERSARGYPKGLKRNHRYGSGELKKQVTALVKKGWRTRDIGIKLGCPDSSVSKIKRSLMEDQKLAHKTAVEMLIAGYTADSIRQATKLTKSLIKELRTELIKRGYKIRSNNRSRETYNSNYSKKKRDLIKVILQNNPNLSISEVARSVGCGNSLVVKVRKELGLSHPKERNFKGGQAIREKFKLFREG